MISADPGVHGSGIAVWSNNTLVDVDYSKPTGYYSDDLVIECPQIYPGIRSKGNPNNLIAVAFEAGRISGLVRGTVRVVKPKEWKGSIKKEVMLKRILGRLTEPELALIKAINLPKSTEHNVVDAIGIGLFALGRL